MHKASSILRSRSLLVLLLLGVIFALAFIELGGVEEARAARVWRAAAQGSTVPTVPEVPTDTPKPTKRPPRKPSKTPTFVYVPLTDTPTPTDTGEPTPTETQTATPSPSDTAAPSATNTAVPTLAAAPTSTPVPVVEEAEPAISLNTLGIISLLAALLGLILLVWVLRRYLR